MSMMGSGGPSRVTRVRMFLEADSAEELVRLQLQNNLKFQSEFSYTDFSSVDGKWFCWFLVDLIEFNRDLLLGVDDGTT